MCDSITVGWTAPHSSPKADSFIVEYRVLEGGDAWSQAEFNWNDTQESLITVEINKLKPLEIYEVTVQAKNYYGNSSVSNPAVTRTNMSGEPLTNPILCTECVTTCKHLKAKAIFN